MALLHSIQRSGFVHDVVHHGKDMTLEGKAAKPQALPGSFSAWRRYSGAFGDYTTAPGLPCLTEKFTRSNNSIWG